MNGVWQEEANLVPADGSRYNYFGYDVDLSGDTDINGPPLDCSMSSYSGCVYDFVRRYGVTWY